MSTLNRAVLACVAASALVVSLSAQGRPKAQVTPLVESSGHAGSKVRVALQVTLPEGLHVQSDKPRDPMLIPTVLTVEPPAGVKVVQVVYPAATDFLQAGQKTPLAVFEHHFAIGVELALDPSVAPGVLAIPARFRYQACDASTCFAPAREAAEWAVSVVASAEPAPAKFADVFSTIPFQRR